MLYNLLILARLAVIIALVYAILNYVPLSMLILFALVLLISNQVQSGPDPDAVLPLMGCEGGQTAAPSGVSPTALAPTNATAYTLQDLEKDVDFRRYKYGKCIAKVPVSTSLLLEKFSDSRFEPGCEAFAASLRSKIEDFNESKCDGTEGDDMVEISLDTVPLNAVWIMGGVGLAVVAVYYLKNKI